MEPQHFNLPWPPSENTVYPTSKTGRRFLSGKGKAYVKAVCTLCVQLKIKMVRGPVSIIVHGYPPDRRVRDGSNYEKILYDSLAKAFVIENDKWIIHHSFTMHNHLIGEKPQKPGRVEIDLQKYEIII